MKSRMGWVSNSSSSSFIIKKEHLTDFQIEKIYNHGEEGEKLGLDYAKEVWSIEDGEDHLGFSTWMNNFDMKNFLTLIGVDISKIENEDY
jgi:hypothetical protein